MNRQRNNLSKLPFAVREKVCALLFDGAGYAEIRKAVAETAPKARIHNTTLLAYAKSAEYRDYQEQRRQWSDKLEKRRWAAGIVNQASGPSAITDLAELAIAEQLHDYAAGGVEMTGKDVATMARAITSMQRTQLARRQETHAAEMAALNEAHAAELAARDEKIAALQERISGMSAGKSVDLKRLGADVDRVLGVN